MGNYYIAFITLDRHEVDWLYEVETIKSYILDANNNNQSKNSIGETSNRREYITYISNINGIYYLYK